MVEPRRLLIDALSEGYYRVCTLPIDDQSADPKAHIGARAVQQFARCLQGD
jgi:hypothetical protein